MRSPGKPTGSQSRSARVMEPRPILMHNNVAYRLVTDHLGSVRAVVRSSDGVVVEQRDFDAWGVQTSGTAPAFQSLGYAGGLTDHDTRIVRFGARDYEPASARWLTRDPSGIVFGEINRYSYCRNSPVNLIDPDGEMPCADFVDELMDLFSTSNSDGVLGTRMLARMDRQLTPASGYRPSLVAGGQGAQVEQHIFGHGGARLLGLPGQVVADANVLLDYLQRFPFLFPGRSVAQSRAELSDDAAAVLVALALSEAREALAKCPSDRAKILAQLRLRLLEILCL